MEEAILTLWSQESRLVEVDITAKIISMGNFHRTFAGSGLNCLGAAALLPGTLPNRLARDKVPGKEQIIRIAQPEGSSKAIYTFLNSPSKKMRKRRHDYVRKYTKHQCFRRSWRKKSYVV